ncbi:MAG: flagellar hook-associated protein FlgK [Calditrichaeota bacterium]|nr:flagellar hook-associated protein FlgK [Calditrichota bacterium]
MSTLSGILELSKQALMVQQAVSNVIGNNVANVNTPGYSRQTALLVPAPTVRSLWGPIGTGVDLARVKRHRDAFLDQQYRQSTAKQSRWQAMSKTLAQVETIFNEPGDTGLQATMDAFWNAWSELANDPENETARVVVREKAKTMIGAFHRASNYLRNQILAIDEEVGSTLSEVNTLLKNIAELNGQIQSLEAQGGPANELRDERDRFIDQLSQYLDTRVIEEKNGTVRVLVGTSVLIQGTKAGQITGKKEQKGDLAVTVLYDPSGRELSPSQGKLAGLLEMRDEVLPSYLQKLDDVAGAIVKEVNLRHRLGYTMDGDEAGDFFAASGTTAGSISLSSAVEADVRAIATSSDGTAGDNSVALAIAKLRSDLVMSDGQQTITSYYAALVSQVGIDASDASDALANQEVVTNTLEQQKQSVQGVSLDEEMAELIKFQHAYAASAQVINVVDEMTKVVLSLVR